MKILYDSDGLEILDGFIYIYKRDVFRRKRLYYKFKSSCVECKSSFFMRLSYPTEFCSKKCANSSLEVRKKISKAMRGRTLTKKQLNNLKMLGKKRSKGGVVERNLPLFNTYAKQLSLAEKVKNVEGLLYVKCSFCRKWFLPKRTAVEARAQFIKGNIDRESRLYCSDECKSRCPIFHKKKYPEGFNPRKNRNSAFFTESELRIWSKEVLFRANNRCELCGHKAYIAHHIIPKKLFPEKALDPDNGLAVCGKCHNKVHINECSFHNLASIKCTKNDS